MEGLFMKQHNDGISAVGEDQLTDWAKRKGISVEEARRRAGKLG
jgi:hypothetical protein